MADTDVNCYGDGPCSVLVMPDFKERTTEAFLTALPSDWKNKYKLYFPDKSKILKDKEEAEIYNLLVEKCCEIVKKHKISVVFADRKMSNLMKSCLAKQATEIKGPSVESVTLSAHKYYCSKLIDSSDVTFPEMLVDLDCDIYETCRNLLFNLGLPCYARAGFNSENSRFVCKNKEEVINALQVLKYDSDIMLKKRLDFTKSIPEFEKYPLLMKPVATFKREISRFRVTQSSSFESVFIEAAVYNGEIIPWAISDAVTLPHGSEEPTKYFLGYEMPTKLSQTKQDLLWERFSQDLENLKKKGFDNSFVYGEYNVFNEDMIELLNINCFPRTNNVHMYNHTLKGGNNVDASLQLSNGVKPTMPTLTGSYALTHVMIVLNSGKADALINFEAAKDVKDLFLRYRAGEEIHIAEEKSFVIIGVIAVTGNTFEDCIQQIGEIRKAVIKIQELVPLANN